MPISSTEKSNFAYFIWISTATHTHTYKSCLPWYKIWSFHLMFFLYSWSVLEKKVTKTVSPVNKKRHHSMDPPKLTLSKSSGQLSVCIDFLELAFATCLSWNESNRNRYIPLTRIGLIQSTEWSLKYFKFDLFCSKSQLSPQKS